MCVRQHAIGEWLKGAGDRSALWRIALLSQSAGCKTPDTARAKISSFLARKKAALAVR